MSWKDFEHTLDSTNKGMIIECGHNKTGSSLGFFNKTIIVGLF